MWVSDTERKKKQGYNDYENNCLWQRPHIHSINHLFWKFNLKHTGQQNDFNNLLSYVCFFNSFILYVGNLIRLDQT